MVDKYSVIIFDIDGVIWNRNIVVENSIETLNALESQGKKIFFISNNSTYSVETIRAKLEKNGYNARSEQILCAAFTIPLYLRELKPGISTVLSFGEAEFQSQLKLSGLRVVDIHSLPECNSTDPEFFKLETDDNIEAVVLTLDKRFTLRKFYYAARCVSKGAILISPHQDSFLSFKSRKFPAIASFIAMFEKFCGATAHVIGKPHPFSLEYIINSHNFFPSEIIIAGDRLEFDIKQAQDRGIDSLFVLSGEQREEDIDRTGIIPTYISKSIGSFFLSKEEVHRI